MNTCKNCQSETTINEVNCMICNYPIKGTAQEQASFISTQILQKSDVEESLARLKKARTILWILGAFYIIVPFTPFFISSNGFDIGLNVIIGVLFAGFGFLTFKQPTTALLIPLILTTIYYVMLLALDPAMFVQGLVWKVIVVAGLGYGYISVKKSNKILKENPYLASLVGFHSIGGK